MSGDWKKRPTSAQIAARKWEIKLRYQRKASKVGKRSRGMAAIRLAELTRWLDNTHGAGHELTPSEDHELTPSEDSVMVVRIFAHHMVGLPDMPRRVTAWLERYASWLDLASRERLISECATAPLKWSADKLAWKLRLTDQQRTKLRITTIGAIDCSKKQRAERRRKRHAELARIRRAAKRVTTI